MLRTLCSSLVAVIFSAIWVPISVAEEPMDIQLSSEKGTYRKGESIVFHLSVKNRSEQDVPVLVRLYDWADLKRMEDNYLKRRSELQRLAAEKDPPKSVTRKLENLRNLAADYRAEGGVRPLGELEVSSAPGAQSKYDVDGLDCGTFLKSGRMPAGEKVNSSFCIPAPMVPGTYNFSWRLVSASKGSVWERGKAVSNAVTVQIVD
jgi:hypothetical protein